VPALGVRPERVAEHPHQFQALPASEERRRTRISGRRVLGLTLPGLLVIDALLVTGSFVAAVQLLARYAGLATSSPSVVGPQLLALFAVLVAGFLLLGGMFGLYERRSLFAPRLAMTAAARALFWSGALAVAFAFVLALEPPGDLRLLLLGHAALLSIGVMTVRPLACRGLIRLAEVGPVYPRRALILGMGEAARRVAAALEARDPEGVTIAGLAGPEPDGDGRRGFRKWARFELHGWEDAVRLADALSVEEVIFASEQISRPQAVMLAERLTRLGLTAQPVPHLTRLNVAGIPLHRERGLPLAHLGRPRHGRLGVILKRCFDISVTLAGGIVLLPLLLVIALAVKLSSPGPILYAQTRVGRDGRTFKMFKFRSMVVSNDDSHHRRYVAALVRRGSAAGEDADGRPVYKLVHDPRVTVVGRMIRATSLDELPQLINVLRGEMSLVGPRPCLPFEYELYEDWQRLRLGAPPGITGLWQVSGRSLLDFEEMVLLDLYYAANWSFLLDLKILWRTIPEVFCWRGVR